MFAYVLALEAEGVTRDEIEMGIGGGEATVSTDGCCLKAPIEGKISMVEEEPISASLERLLIAYDHGELDSSRIADIKTRNEFADVCKAIREYLRDER